MKRSLTPNIEKIHTFFTHKYLIYIISSMCHQTAWELLGTDDSKLVFLSCLVLRMVGLIAGGTAAQAYITIQSLAPLPEAYSLSLVFILASYVSPRLDSAISRPVHPGPGHRYPRNTSSVLPSARADLAEFEYSYMVLPQLTVGPL